jgi:hypothetical protein
MSAFILPDISFLFLITASLKRENKGANNSLYFPIKKAPGKIPGAKLFSFYSEAIKRGAL